MPSRLVHTIPATPAIAVTAVSVPAAIPDGRAPDGQRTAGRDRHAAHHGRAALPGEPASLVDSCRPSCAGLMWRQLEPSHDRLPTLRVYPVDYPAPVGLAIPPETCVVGIAAADIDGRAYVDSVTAAAQQLATLRSGDAAAS